MASVFGTTKYWQMLFPKSVLRLTACRGSRIVNSKELTKLEQKYLKQKRGHSFTRPSEKQLTKLERKYFKQQQTKPFEKPAEKELTSWAKTNVAIVLAYSGINYDGLKSSGMAIERSIGKEFFTALVDASLISTKHLTKPGDTNFSLAQLSSKNTSALQQYVSMELNIPDETVPEVKQRLNTYLPSDIRVIDVCARQKFNARLFESVTFSYTLPTLMFASAVEETVVGYRIQDATLNQLNSILYHYVGLHNFVNFTSTDYSENDKRCMRHVVSCHASPRVFVSGDVEFCTIYVTGRSFLPHQIQKMIALAIAVVRRLTVSNAVTLALKLHKMPLPLVPNFPLILEKVKYSIPEMEFILRKREAELEEFRDTIVTKIVEQELRTKAMLKWLAQLQKAKLQIGDS